MMHVLTRSFPLRSIYIIISLSSLLYIYMESPFILYQVQCPDVITKDSMRSFAILAQRTSDHSQATALFDLRGSLFLGPGTRSLKYVFSSL